MVKGLKRSLSRGEPVRQEIMKATIPFSAVALSVTGASGVGWATGVIGDFPEGNILLLGAVLYVQIDSAGGQSTIVDDWDGDIAVGTTPTADATVTGTDADVIPLTSTTQAATEDVPRMRAASTASIGGSVFDNTDGSLELNLNLIVDDADVSGDAVALTATGEIYLSFVVLGDD